MSNLNPDHHKVADRLLQLSPPCSLASLKLIFVMFCSSPFAVISPWLTAFTKRDERMGGGGSGINMTIKSGDSLHLLIVVTLLQLPLLTQYWLKYPCYKAKSRTWAEAAALAAGGWGLSWMQRWFVSPPLWLHLRFIKCSLRVSFSPRICPDTVLEWAIWLRVVCLFPANCLSDRCTRQQRALHVYTRGTASVICY